MNKTKLIKENDLLCIAPKAFTRIKYDTIGFLLADHGVESFFITHQDFENDFKIKQYLTEKQSIFISISIKLSEEEINSEGVKETLKLLYLTDKNYDLKIYFVDKGVKENILNASANQYEMYITEEKEMILNIKIPYQLTL